MSLSEMKQALDEAPEDQGLTQAPEAEAQTEAPAEVVEPETLEDDSSSAESAEPKSAEAESAEAESAEAVESTEPDLVTQQWPDVDSVTDWTAVDLSALPADAQAFASSLISRATEEITTIKRVQAEFEEAREMFNKLAAGLEQGNGAELAQELETYRGGYNSVATENTVLATELFKATCPDYDKAPPDLKESFAKEVEVEGFYAKWTEGHLAKRMTDCWEFVKGKARWTPPAAADTARAVLIETGSNSGGYEDTPVEGMTTRDILSRHDHLLA